MERASATRCCSPPDRVCGIFVGVVLEADARQGAAGGDARLGGGQVLQPEHDVLQDRHVREQGVVLEHQADAPPLGLEEGPRPADLAPIHQHPAGGRRLDPCGDAQQRGLSAARMAEQADDLARLDGQRDAVERAQAAIDLNDVLEGELGRDRGARRAALAPSGQAKPVAGGAGGGSVIPLPPRSGACPGAAPDRPRADPRPREGHPRRRASALRNRRERGLPGSPPLSAPRGPAGPRSHRGRNAPGSPSVVP